MALDLAVQAAGLVSVPVSNPGAAAQRGARLWLGYGDPAPAPAGLEGVELPPWPAPGEAEGELPDRPPGGAIVVESGGAREIPSEELAAAADRLQAGLLPGLTSGGAPGGRGREIAVAGRAPEHLADRALLAWAAVHGAALLLAEPGALVGAAAWARPTLFLGTAAEIRALRRAAEEERRPFWGRGPRLPFGRLRTVLWSGDEPPAEEEARFWRERGVRVAAV